MGKKCAYCESTENLTVDHIIPRSIWKRFPLKQVGFKKDGVLNKQTLCIKCNGQKANLIDVRSEYGRRFWTAVRDEVDKLLKKEG
jgi:5-methylcytosine-specific restriction endonuclease McrA